MRSLLDLNRSIKLFRKESRTSVKNVNISLKLVNKTRFPIASQVFLWKITWVELDSVESSLIIERIVSLTPSLNNAINYAKASLIKKATEGKPNGRKSRQAFRNREMTERSNHLFKKRLTVRFKILPCKRINKIS